MNHDLSVRIIHETNTEFYVSNLYHELGGEILRVPKEKIQAIRLICTDGEGETLFTIDEDVALEIGFLI